MFLDFLVSCSCSCGFLHVLACAHLECINPPRIPPTTVRPQLSHTHGICRDPTTTTSELWTSVHSFTLIIQPTANIVPFNSLQFTTVFHTISLILCFQQAGEIDNLTVSLGQNSLIVLCADSTLAPDSLVLRRAIFRHRQPSEAISCSYWFD